jgi:hypothetical protein
MDSERTNYSPETLEELTRLAFSIEDPLTDLEDLEEEIESGNTSASPEEDLQGCNTLEELVEKAYSKDSGGRKFDSADQL